MRFFESGRLSRAETRGWSLRREATTGLRLLPLLLLAALLISVLLTTGAMAGSARGGIVAAPLLSPAFQESPAQPAEQPPTEQPPAPPEEPAQPTAEPTAEPVEQEPSPTAPPQTERRKGSSRENPPDLVVDWPMFIDTVVVSLSYLWLCCGGLAMVVVPFALGMAYALGRRRTVPPPGNPEAPAERR
jgi:hypothetical protein